MEMEKRSSQRIPVDAEVRVRAAGSSGRGILCRVRDSSSAGMRLHADQAIDPGWMWIEVLKSSGQPLSEPIEARVVRIQHGRNGCHEFGCSFD